MDVLFRGLCELQIDDIPNESLTHGYPCLLRELDIPEESKGFFLMGYIAGSARSRLNVANLTMFNRPLNGNDIEIFSKVLGRQMDNILEKILEQENEKLIKKESVILEPKPGISGDYEEPSDEVENREVPLKTVAAIGKPEVEEEKFSFKISGKKKSSPTILGIPVHT